MRTRTFLALLLTLLTHDAARRPPHATLAAAQDDEAAIKARLKPIPPREPAEALKTFRLVKGFRIELVAAEPDVTSPVDIAFDADGRMFVVEMRGYPFGTKDPRAPLGQVRLLEDRDGDGVMDRSHVFVDGLDWPTAVTCWDGGIFVAVAPEVLYCKDTDDDGVADVRRVVYTGFGKDNVQALLNNLKWGLDNGIYGANGGNGGVIRRPDQPDVAPVSLGRRDFRFDPRSGRFEAISGGGQFGHSFDAWGRRFVCNNSNHARHVVLASHYLERNPYLAVSEVIAEIAGDGAAAPVFRLSAPEPWRVIRTRMRASAPDAATKYAASELVPAGFFTSATGITVYRGGLFGPEFDGNLFIGDVGGNLVHRKRLLPNGATFTARRPEGEEKVEFLASTDNWFRPCNFAVGPDGALYIADFYREFIEHPESIPEVIKQHLDLNTGNDRGRIWRIVPADFRQPARRPRLSTAGTEKLVELLDDPNAWWREAAQRMLIERADPAAVEPLERFFASAGAGPLGRLHALWTLQGLGKLDGEIVAKALEDSHAGVRENAVRLAEAKSPHRRPLFQKLSRLGQDPDPRVRFQLALALGEIKGPEIADGKVAEAWIAIARRDAADPWTRTALLSSATEVAAPLLDRLCRNGEFAASTAGAALLGELAVLVGTRNRPDEIVSALRLLSDRSVTVPPRVRRLLVSGLGDGLGRAGGSLRKLVALSAPELEAAAEAVARMFEDSATAAADEALAVEERLAAIRLLRHAPAVVVLPILPPLMNARQPQAIQLAAVRALNSVDDARVAGLLLDGWAGASPPVRREMAEVLFSRAERLPDLLDAIEDGRVARGDLDATRIQQLLAHPDAAIKQHAQTLLGGALNKDRAKVVGQYLPALKLTGDPQRGERLYRKHCATCHKVSEEGFAVGPDWASVANRDPEALLISILDPNRETAPQYTNYVLTTDFGTTVTGMIAAETATSVTLRRAEGAEDTVLRRDIESLESTGASLMPEGLEKEVGLQDIADLLEYVARLTKK